MRPNQYHRRPGPVTAIAIASILSVLGYSAPLAAATEPDTAEIQTASPIKHVIIIVGASTLLGCCGASLKSRRGSRRPC